MLSNLGFGNLLSNNPISLYRPVGYGHVLNYNGSSSQVTYGSAAGVDNLQSNALTAEAWIKATGYGSSNIGHVWSKRGTSGGWNLYVNSTNGLAADLICATTNGSSAVGLDEFTADSLWHHVAMTWDNAGTRKINIFIDGVEASSYLTQVAGVGAITTDATNLLRMGSHNGSLYFFAGSMGWSRVSNIVRYTGTFTPNALCNPPATDANTVVLIKLFEGTGNPQDSSGNANNGTASNTTWSVCS